MKKVLLTLSAVAFAASVFAQGTVVMNNRVTGTLITHIYSGGAEKFGNGPTDFPVGATDWTGYTLVAGSGYTAALLAAPGANQPLANLTWQPNSTTTFRTGTGAGFLAGTTATLDSVAKDAQVATLAMVVWDNKGGTITTWAQALAAWQAGQISAGISPKFDVASIGGDFNVPANLLGLQSFAIYPVPEPTTMALAGLGAAALLIFRRRK